MTASARSPLPVLLLILLVGSVYRALALHWAGLNLYVDEAQYWTWSQSLDWGYYSKPPVIAAIIAFTTGLFGDGELAIKSGALLLYPLTTLLIYALALRLYDRRIAFWSALAFFGLVSFPLATAYFVWSVAVGSVAIGLMPVLVGVPILVLLLGSARAICLFEGKMVEALLGVRMPRRTQPVAGADHVDFWQRIWCWLRDIRSWMSLGYLLGNFFVSVVTFVLTLTLTAVSAAFLLLPLLQLLGLPMAQVDGVDTVLFLGRDLAPDADGNVWFPASATVPCVAIGLVGLTAVLWMVRGFGWVYGHVVQAIQVARPQPTVPPRPR